MIRQMLYSQRHIAMKAAVTLPHSGGREGRRWGKRVFLASAFLCMLAYSFLPLPVIHAANNVVQKDHPYFYTGFEAGDIQPTWRNTREGGIYPAGGANSVGAICCRLSGPEMTVRREWAHEGSAALLYSGYAMSPTDSYVYMKVFDTSQRKLIVDQDTELDYWIYPQSALSTIAGTRGLVSGSNSSCVAVDLIFSDGGNLRDSTLRDQYGNYIHPRGQCNHLKLDTWNYVSVNLGFLIGRQIVRIDVGYEQAGHTGGYRGYIDQLTIRD